MKTEFFLPMKPPTATKQQRGHTVKNGKHIFYSRQDGETEQKLTAYLSKHIPEKPYSGAIAVEVVWCFLAGKSHCSGEPHTNKPDADNLCKLLYDTMTKLRFWKDDKQICRSVTTKMWSDVPGIFIRIEEV